MNPEIQEKLKKANFAYKESRYDDAMALYQEVLAAEPQNPSALKHLGDCYFYLEEHKKAEYFYLQYEEIMPGDVRVIYNIGLIAEMRKDYNEAIKKYEAAIRLDPTFELAKSNLKMVKEIHLWLEGDWAKQTERRWSPGQDWNDTEDGLPNKSVTSTTTTSQTPEEAMEDGSTNGGEEKKKENPPMSVEEAMAALNELIGLNSVKDEIEELVATLEIQARRGSDSKKAKHFVFTGNPGTGKTTVARLLANIFHAIGYMPTNTLIEADRGKLVAQFAGQTAPKVHKFCDDAMGGVLFIDEAYALQQSDHDEFGREAISTLLKRMEDDRGKFVVIAAGYKKEMHDFIASNPGLKSRFTDYIDFPDYNAKDLKAIFDLMAGKEKFVQGEGVGTALEALFEDMCMRKDRNFANARNARNVLEETIENLSLRFYRMQKEGKNLDEIEKSEFSIIQIEDLPTGSKKKLTVDKALSKLDRLIGLKDVKRNIQRMIERLEIEQLRGNPAVLDKHFVFTGNAGTGKTTVARLLANIFHAAGLLPTGNLIEADRAEMVAPYAGQTAPKVEDLCDRAMGGLLFIDEAYSLKQSEQDDFGSEAINTLLKRMEDDRGKFVAIAAGYPYEMEVFLNSNSGLKSRFSEYIDFPDFEAAEMAEIFKLFSEEEGFQLSEECDDILLKVFSFIEENKDVSFANARTVRQIFEETLNNQASRVIGLKRAGATDEELTAAANCILPEDIYRPKEMPLLDQVMDVSEEEGKKKKRREKK